jgi:shikimate kinase
MRIFLAGVSCVGKTTVGIKLAELLGCPFFDL